MINVNDKNKMQRHEQIIELADHVKNKLKQHKHPPAPPSLMNSSDEFTEIHTTDDENELDSSRVTPHQNETRSRHDTYTLYEVRQSSGPFFTDRKPKSHPDISVLQEKYQKQQQCQECIRRDRIIYLQRQDLLHLYDQNKQLNNELRSSVLLNHQYEGNIQQLKQHLTKVNSHLYEYQIHFDYLKQKILSDKNPSPKIADKQEDEDEEEDVTIDHLKRLRYEIQMYNRIVAAKQKQEDKNQQKQIEFLF